MLVAGLVEIRLSLPGESVDLLKPGPGYPTFKNTEVLFGVDIKRLLVDRCVILVVFGGTVDVVGGDLVGVDVLKDVVVSQGTVSGR